MDMEADPTGQRLARQAAACNRPCQRKDQLVSRKIIPDATYKGIKEPIIAKQAAPQK